MYVFVCISASAGVNSLDRYTFQFPRILYKLCKFGFDRSIMKSILLGQPSTFLSVSRLSTSGNSLVRYTVCFRIMRYIYLKFDCDQSHSWRALYLKRKSPHYMF
jgi:hypothetical protein